MKSVILMVDVLGVFARANHPKGWGHEAGAHGYVIVVVECASWAQLDDVVFALGSYDYKDGKPLWGYDPWHRNDAWFAGPYELTWAAETDVHLARGQSKFHTMAIGQLWSYGDNRAVAYMKAEDVLREP